MQRNGRDGTGGVAAHAGKPGGKSIWYRWTPSRTGIATIDTRGSSFDTLLAVYTGSSVAALQVVGSDEDSGGFYTSRLKIPVVAGVEYSIAVDGYAGASGQVVLSWSLDPSTDVLPRIVTPPVSVAATLGGEAQFSVVAVPAGVTFQWFFKGAAIAGATASTLQVTPVGYRDVGAYTVQVQGGPGRVVLSAGKNPAARPAR
ncbi:MAG TPA: immunoglobulin domain-containing protein, partial [Myxococcota bacterium]|nr:immunoglobulin domain-containing protein [Myxococcota bacterium]